MFKRQLSKGKQALAVLAALCLPAGIAIGFAQPAQALGIADWDPGYIISDAVFYNKNSMSEAQIRDFILEKGKNCTPSGGKTCLKDMTFPTKNQAPVKSDCAALDLTGNHKPWTIFYRTAQACGINPQVLLATLQKEQGGVTNAITAEAWGKAMGAGCPDTAACDPKQAGFQRQVYLAANKLMGYIQYPAGFPRMVAARDRVPINIAYSPTCSATTSILIKNMPTAALYTYTPYTPNAASLTAYPGPAQGDSCASYGNRNFYMNMQLWFPTLKTERIAGEDRMLTAVAVSKKSFSSSPIVYLARQDVLTDAQTAGTLKDGPILLVPSSTPAPQAILDEINRLGATTVIVLGGVGAISEEAAQGTAQGRKVERLNGANRSETARRIADRWIALHGAPTNIYIANAGTSEGSIDAAVAGTLRQGPILTLSNANQGAITANAQWIAEKAGGARIYAIGGTGVVPDAAMASITAAQFTRLGGADRFETSALIADHALATGTPKTTLYIATGRKLADSAVAGVLTNGPLLLMGPGADGVPAATANFASAKKFGSITAVGGTGAVSGFALESVAASAGAATR